MATNEAIKFENQIINNVQAGKNAIKPLLTKEEATNIFKNLNLTPGQKEACELIATTSARFVMIQGYAGTGKTTMNKHMIDVVKAASSQSLDLIAIAPPIKPFMKSKN